MLKINNTAKIIFHIDMNMFFCSVAVIKNPQLKGKAFAIGRENTLKGVISTASYEARKYGIHSAMPISDALRILPSLIILNSDFKLYSYYHECFVNLVREYTDIIEVASIDELYADMTVPKVNIHPLEIAKLIQYRLVKEYHLPSSIGIAPTLFLAKMASDIKKPMGITILRKRDIENILYPLPVKDIFGIGKKTYPKLMENGINTIGDFMNLKNRDLIISITGNKIYDGEYNALTGNSSSIVDPNRYKDSESISTSSTYDTYLTEYDDIYLELREMAKKLLAKMKKDEYSTKTISITLRDSNFKTITRSKTIDYTENFYEIIDVIEELLEQNYHGEELRLVGVGFSNLKKTNEVEIEYNLFTYQSFIEKENRIEKLVDEFRDKYGDIIRIGVEKNKEKK